DAEIVGLVGQLHVIVLARQALSEPRHAHGPRAGIVQLPFQLHAEPALAGAAPPSLPAGAALVAEAAHEVAAGGVVAEVPEPGDIDAVGPVALVVVVEQAFDAAARAGQEMMVHEVVAQHAARVGEPVGEAWRLGVEQHPRRAERRGAEKDDARVVFSRLLRDRSEEHTSELQSLAYL